MAFKMNARSPLMKTLVGGQKNLPEGLKNAIEAAPGKMMDSPAKNMNKGYGSPAKKEYSDRGTRLRGRAEKAEARGNEKRAGKLNKKADKYDKKQISGLMGSLEKAGAFDRMTPTKMKSPAKKSKAKVEQDYARNAISDYKKGDKKAAGYEKKKALEVAAGEGK